jgi:hypothetical protein
VSWLTRGTRLATSLGAGRVLRATLIRPNSVWRVPWGLARGLRLEVDQGAPLHIYLGTAEIELAVHVRRFARPGVRVCEVGGYDAYYAMVFARLTQADVTSFEFRDEAVARMRRNLALNPGLAERVKIIQTYVANESGDTPRTDTIDRMVASATMVAPDLMIIDVEGAEAMVLGGARDLLWRRRPDLIVETHSHELEDECVGILRDSGYTPLIVNQRRWLPEKRGSGHNRWLVADGCHTPLGAGR